jgi:hypothetical protein
MHRNQRLYKILLICFDNKVNAKEENHGGNIKKLYTVKEIHI